MKTPKFNLTTFGGRLCYAMEKREFSAQKMAQELCRQGFACTRKNIEQWWLIDDHTWRGIPEINDQGQWIITSKGKNLKSSRPPYPGEIQLMVLILNINGMWLFVGGDLPMERGGGIPTTKDDLNALWESDTDTRQLISYIMKLDPKAKQHLLKYLMATGQMD